MARGAAAGAQQREPAPPVELPRTPFRVKVAAWVKIGPKIVLVWLALLLGLLLRVLCPWWFLWRAERTLREHARVHVLIGEKRRVLLNASLNEFAQWGRLLTDEEAGRGRRIAVIGKATVAIVRLP